MLLLGKTNLDEMDSDFPSWSIANGIIEVMLRTTGFQMTPERVTMHNLRNCQIDYSASFILLGERKAIFTIATDRKSAKMLVSEMTKLSEVSLEEEDLIDGLAEIANIIGGDVKAKLSGKEGACTVLLPFAVSGNDHYMFYKSKGPLFIRMFRRDEIVLFVQAHSIDVK